MRKKIAFVAALAVLLSACTGSFTLTGKVYQFNRDIDDQWMEEVVFLGLCIIPVYEIALIADAVIFNSVEFWTGENLIADAGQAAQSVWVKVEDQEATIIHLEDGRVRVETPTGGFILARSDEGVTAVSLDGTVRHRTVRNADGTVSIYDQAGTLIRTFRPGEIVLPLR